MPSGGVTAGRAASPTRDTGPGAGLGLFCCEGAQGSGRGPERFAGPRLPPMAGLARATKLRGGQVQQKLFHWKKKVTCGRDRRNRGRGLSSHLAPASDRVPGVTVTWGYHSKQLGPRGLACEWPLKSIWALWPGASGGHLEEEP